MRRHVVIGGCGFTGTYLVRELLRTDRQVVVLDTAALPKEFQGRVQYCNVDIRDRDALRRIPLDHGDIAYHLAARQFHSDVPKHAQDEWFAAVNVTGTDNVLAWLGQLAEPRLVYLSTDMVYGVPETLPVPPSHKKSPLGPYGRSKAASELLCERARAKGYRVTVLRPRMIVGPGRFGILVKLFRLMDMGLPVPMIGSGRNRYQMIAVEDVVSAVLASVEKGFPQMAFNLGSGEAPPVRELLSNTIRRIGSRSVVVPVPAGPLKMLLSSLEKLGMPLLYREQYQIADINYTVDIEPTAAVLGWRPQKNDEDMLVGAYERYRADRDDRDNVARTSA